MLENDTVGRGNKNLVFEKITKAYATCNLIITLTAICQCPTNRHMVINTLVLINYYK